MFDEMSLTFIFSIETLAAIFGFVQNSRPITVMKVCKQAYEISDTFVKGFLFDLIIYVPSTIF